MAKTEEPKGLSALVVKVQMKPAHRERFLEEMLADAIGSEKNEPGCLMFNVVHDDVDPNVLYLFEVYQDAQAVQAHKTAPHFQRWLVTTEPWLAAPLQVMPSSTIYPPANAWEKRPAP